MIFNSLMLPTHFHDVTYDHIWSKILKGLQRVQQEIQEQSSNTEESELRAMPSKTRVLHEFNTKESLIIS